MKSFIRVAEIRQGLLAINQHRISYSVKASEKLRELNLKAFFIGVLEESTKNESVQIHEIPKPTLEPVGKSHAARSKFYRFRMEVKSMLNKGYELE